MDKENKIIDLKLKLIELKLEKEKDVFSLSLSIVVGLLTFIITTGYVAQLFKEYITNIVKTVITWPYQLGFIIIIILIFGLPFLAVKISGLVVDRILKEKEKIFDDRMKEIRDIISDLEAKKK